MSNWKCLNKFKIFLNRATTEIEKVRVKGKGKLIKGKLHSNS